METMASHQMVFTLRVRSLGPNLLHLYRDDIDSRFLQATRILFDAGRTLHRNLQFRVVGFDAEE